MRQDLLGFHVERFAMTHVFGWGPPHPALSPTAWGRGLLAVLMLMTGAVARADDTAGANSNDNGDIHLEVYSRGWTATPTFWSDGHTSIIVVPDADAAGAAPAQDSDATMAINRYITQSGKDCAIDGVLHAIGPEITGTRAGWAANLKCK